MHHLQHFGTQLRKTCPADWSSSSEIIPVNTIILISSGISSIVALTTAEVLAAIEEAKQAA